MLSKPAGRSTLLLLAVVLFFDSPDAWSLCGASVLTVRAEPVLQSPETKPSFEQLAQQALAAQESKRPIDAVPFYRKALQVKPEWAEGWWNLATVQYELHLFSEALEGFQKLTVLQPNEGPIWAFLGLCQFELGRYEEAAVNLQKARLLGLGTNRQLILVTRYHVALLLTYFGHFEAAQNALKRFGQDNNRSMPILELLGLNALRMQAFPWDVPAERRDLVVMAGRALYYTYRTEFERADWHFEQLAARYPEAPNVHYAYGVYLMRDHPEKGLQEFLRELEISPDHVAALSQVAFEYLNQGEHEKGLPYAQKAVRLDPDSFPAKNALGRILLAAGDVDGAITQLEAGIRLNFDSPEMHFALARAYSRAGRREDNLRELKIFKELSEQRQQILEGYNETKRLKRKDP